MVNRIIQQPSERIYYSIRLNFIWETNYVQRRVRLKKWIRQTVFCLLADFWTFLGWARTRITQTFSKVVNITSFWDDLASCVSTLFATGFFLSHFSYHLRFILKITVVVMSPTGIDMKFNWTTLARQGHTS